MGSEFKRTMKLMCSHKQYRRVFGMHPGIIGVCIFGAVVGGLLPLICKLVGEEINYKAMFLSVLIPTFFYFIMFINFGNQFMVTVGSGKSLLSIPGARNLLTKGIMLSRLVNLGMMIPITLLMQMICIWSGCSEKILVDDLLLLYGIAYVTAAISAAIPLIGSFMAMFIGVGSCIINIWGKEQHSDKIKALMLKAYEYDMPWWQVTILFVLLLVGGTLLGIKLLERSYEKRRVAIPLDQRVAQQ